jgi:prepilin-type N-terminal cleavage/methylation domain-containing protein
MTPTSGSSKRSKQRGFSILEMLIAVVVLMVGALGVAQLIPFSLQNNTGNRGDSTGLVVAQRELEQFLQQPINNTTYTNSTNVDDPCYNVVCNLGTNAAFNQFQGSPTVVVGGRTMIDFTQATVANYSVTYRDGRDPTKSAYDVRWAVSTNGNAGNIMSKRIVISVRRDGPGAYIRPTTLDVVVYK